MLMKNKDAASVTGCLLRNFRLASLKSYLKYFKYLKNSNFILGLKAISRCLLRKFFKYFEFLELFELLQKFQSIC